VAEVVESESAIAACERESLRRIASCRASDGPIDAAGSVKNRTSIHGAWSGPSTSVGPNWIVQARRRACCRANHTVISDSGLRAHTSQRICIDSETAGNGDSRQEGLADRSKLGSTATAVKSGKAGIIRAIRLMSSSISAALAPDAAAPRPRRHFLCVALVVAAIANALVPAVFFSGTHLFGQTDPRYRAIVAFVVLVEYAIAFLLLLLHTNVGFASGYSVATSGIVALGSAALAVLTLSTAGWSWNALYAEIVGVAGIAFAVLSNFVFLASSIRYARAIHPRLHLGGFFLGVAASLVPLYLYTRLLP
jgi:hypothetical protein